MKLQLRIRHQLVVMGLTVQHRHRLMAKMAIQRTRQQKRMVMDQQNLEILTYPKNQNYLKSQSLTSLSVSKD